MKYTITRKNDAGSSVTKIELVTKSLSEACALARRKSNEDDARFGSTVKMAGNFWTVSDEKGEYYNPQTEQNEKDHSRAL